MLFSTVGPEDRDDDFAFLRTASKENFKKPALGTDK